MKRLQAAPEEADIVDLTHEAQGVARIDGKAVFVADALPGERVRLRRTHRHRKVDYAITEEVLRASPDRVVPRCPHFGTCGGCALQHLAPAAQLAFKQAQLLENLARVGDVQPGRVLEPLTGPVWNYRRRARLGIKLVPRKGKVLVGFRERSSPYVADLHECHVMVEPVGALITPLGQLVASLDIADRVPQAEVAVSDDVVAFVLRVLAPPSADDLQRLTAFEQAQGVRLYLQPGGPETVAPLRAEGVAAPLRYRLDVEGTATIDFEPTDFIQVNGVLNQAMVARALQALEPRPGEAVLDLFCGLGNFSLPLARRAGTVAAVEGDEGLVRRARANAERNHVTNVGFHVANLFEDVVGLPWTRRPYDRVLLDPPRAGAKEVLPVVAGSGATRVVYISCHSGSLARDAGLLVREHGYTLSAAGVMDMFPHTTHVEAMAIFDR
ncbi:MAG TPA: 23S rRNA (uracil(1939)-C(5))-methyltransferase RlmD [Steroidobacteraceae bacterium]|nr:23S rRNA (uracil(1939)-C(5))-methyltransferase RlmD [Steroidobacteraceae bacterium]